VLLAGDGAPRGFAWYLPSGTFAAGGYLRLIALAPGGERHGLGGALLDAVERDVAAHARHLFLLVSDWNDGARRFYARRGYAEVGRLPAFVLPDTDEIICCKRLPQK
jgi:ribosomal protein S18 acetylase RimI-like enzyme